jgi:hypothetical protein
MYVLFSLLFFFRLSFLIFLLPLLVRQRFSWLAKNGEYNSGHLTLKFLNIETQLVHPKE